MKYAEMYAEIRILKHAEIGELKYAEMKYAAQY